MRGVRVVCKACKYYMEEGISQRCTLEENTYYNWIGLVYKEHPTQRNILGRCKTYEEVTD